MMGSYNVQAGDTLWGIYTKEFGMSERETLAAINKQKAEGVNVDLIMPGEWVYKPVDISSKTNVQIFSLVDTKTNIASDKLKIDPKVLKEYLDGDLGMPRKTVKISEKEMAQLNKKIDKMLKDNIDLNSLNEKMCK